MIRDTFQIVKNYDFSPTTFVFTTDPSKVVHVVILERAGGRRRGRQWVFWRLGALQYVPTTQSQPQLSAELGVVDGGQLVGPEQALAYLAQRDFNGHRRRAAELGADWMPEILRMEGRQMTMSDCGRSHGQHERF